MIKKISLKNIKCFEDISFDFGQLNVFAGLNGMGKSTIIQSVLLIEQSRRQGFLPAKICLNGELVSIGEGKDLLFENADEDSLAIAIQTYSGNTQYNIIYKEKADVLDCVVTGTEEICLTKGNFEYLNAERNAPKVIYDKSSFYVDSRKNLGDRKSVV